MAGSTLENFYLRLGNPGKYQVIVLMLLWCTVLPNAMLNMFNIYFAYTPYHHCKLPSNWGWNLTESIPVTGTEDDAQLDRCHMYMDPSNHSLGVTKCLYGWTYDIRDIDNYVVSEWDLVCDDRWLVSIGLTVNYVGVMVGSVFISALGDIYGRKPVMTVTALFQASLGIGIAFVNGFVLFIVLRSILLMCLQGLIMVIYTMSCEMVQPVQRPYLGVINTLPWSLAVIFVSFLTYSLGNWRYVHLVLGLMGVLPAIYSWFLPESLRWLLLRQHTEKAEEIIRKIAKFNEVRLPSTLTEEVKGLSFSLYSESSKGSKASIFNLIIDPTMRKVTLLLCIFVMAAMLLYYGVAFSVPGLGTAVYYSFMISGTIELTVRVAIVFALNRYGRLKPYRIFTVLSALSVLTSGILKIWSNANNPVMEQAVIYTALLSSILLVATFPILFLMSSEMYPTELRSVGMGVTGVASRIGNVIAPQILLLGMYIWEPLPFLVFGVCALGAASLSALLKDTHMKPLPDTIREAEKTLS